MIFLSHKKGLSHESKKDGRCVFCCMAGGCQPPCLRTGKGFLLIVFIEFFYFFYVL